MKEKITEVKVLKVEAEIEDFLEPLRCVGQFYRARNTQAFNDSGSIVIRKELYFLRSLSCEMNSCAYCDCIREHIQDDIDNCLDLYLISGQLYQAVVHYSQDYFGEFDSDLVFEECKLDAYNENWMQIQRKKASQRKKYLKISNSEFEDIMGLSK